MELHHGRELVVETAPPCPLQLDGNAAGESARAEFRVFPQALSVVLPEKSAPATIRPDVETADERR